MNRSIGERAQPASFTSGTGGSTGRVKAHCRRAAVKSYGAAAGAVVGPAVEVRGSGAPIFTQATRSATCCSVSRLPFGGICRSGLV